MLQLFEESLRAFPSNKTDHRIKKRSNVFRHSTINNFVGLYPLFPFLPAFRPTPLLSSCNTATKMDFYSCVLASPPSLVYRDVSSALPTSSTLLFCLSVFHWLLLVFSMQVRDFLFCFVFLLKLYLPLFCAVSLFLSLLSKSSVLLSRIGLIFILLPIIFGSED